MISSLIRLHEIPVDAEAIFRARPNRYLGIVDFQPPRTEKNVKVHIHDPGRLEELLYPGSRVLLRHIPAAHRKTEWDVLAAHFGNQWVLVHSGHHRKIAEAIFQNSKITPFPEMSSSKAEVKYGRSRVDFVISTTDNRQIWVEQKGCTLARDKIALFPDAPTKRGSKHLQTLMEIREKGIDAAILILIFRLDATCFKPNQVTDPEFSELFYEAMRRGVMIFPIVVGYEDSWIYYKKRIPVCTDI